MSHRAPERRSTTPSSPRSIGPLVIAIHDRRAWTRNGWTGERLPRRPPRARSRRLSRFLVFALIVILGVGALTARLFYLQIANGKRVRGPVHRRIGRSSSRSRAPRGLIYDRNGRLLVSNVPTFAVKVRPVGPAERSSATRSSTAWPPSSRSTRRTSTRRSTATRVGLRPRPDRRRTWIRRRPHLISEAGYRAARASRSSVEARREYTDGPLMSQLLGYTGPVSAEQLPDLPRSGYLPDDLIGKIGLETRVRDGAARHLRRGERRAGRLRTPDAGPPDGDARPSRATPSR